MTRLHNSARPLKAVRSVRRHDLGDKPNGIWYGIGQAWIEWCRTDAPHWIGKHNYELELDESRLLILRSVKEIERFVSKYASPHPGLNLDPKYHPINWTAVAAQYGGIEIAPYQWSLRHRMSWYYTWDVASGCVWDKKVVLGFKRVEITCA